MQSEIDLTVRPTAPDAALSLTVRFDGIEIYHADQLTHTAQVHHAFVDSPDCVRVLEIQMANKAREHTRIDAQGNILSDALFSVDALTIDGIDCMPLLLAHGTYHHDFNGTAESFQDEFWGLMGCNGVVRFEIAGGIYAMLCDLIQT